MNNLIAVKIDVNKIDKSKFFQGKKGKYLNVILIPTPTSKYSDYMAKQEDTEEERQQKIKTPIIGNAKILEAKGGNGNGGGKAQDKGGEDDW